ncbi:MAG: pre-peptidase C-terminal domain-containing protein [Tateyamaria sp.]|uniref:pre-peptidase C-terminal domain-containing protein n=1 Tax=Tateyamaria sp. TaxID=1929288 RepID=UPI00329EE637
MTFTDFDAALDAVENQIGSIEAITREFFSNLHLLSETSESAIRVLDLPLDSDIVLNFEGNALVPSNLTLGQLNNVFGLLTQSVSSVTALRDTFDNPDNAGANVVDIVTGVASSQVGLIAGVAVTGFASVTVGLPALAAIGIGAAAGLVVTAVADAAFNDAAEHLNIANILTDFSTGLGTAAAWVVTSLPEGLEWLNSVAEEIGEALYDTLINDLLGTFFDFLAGEPDFEAGGLLSVGQSYFGTIDGGGDEDWFTIDLVAGQEVRITQQMSDTFFNADLRLFDANGELFANENPAISDNDTAIIEGTVLESGRYYIVASGSSNQTYTISTELVDLPETITELGNAPDGPTTPYMLDVGETFQGVIANNSNDDRDDWIAIDLVAGQEVRITQQMDDTFFNAALQLFDANGELFANANPAISDNDTSIIEGTVLETGRYYIAASGTPNQTYTISTELVDLPATITELGNAPEDPTTPYMLDVGETFQGVIANNTNDDRDDWIAIDLVAGQEVRITQQMSDRSNFATLQLFDADGELFANENSAVSDHDTSIIEGTVLETGRYYIAASGSFNQMYTISTELVDLPATITELGNAPDDPTTPYMLDVGETFQGVIANNSNDDRDDWIAIDLVAGQEVRITQQMSDTSNFATLQLFDANGELFANENPAISDHDTSIIEETISVSGRYFIVAQGATNGSYVLSLETLPIIGGQDGEQLLGTAFDDVIEGLAGNDTLFGFAGTDTLIGGDGNDSLGGGGGADSLDGDGGADVLNGGNDADVLSGGDGADVLNGGNGADVLNGGSGADTLNGNGDADTLNGNAGADTLNGNAGNDTLNGGNGADTLNGGNDADVLNGGNNADLLNGGNGADTLNGNGGADTLNGNAGADTLNGNAGNDTLNGGNGADTLNGGNDADVLNGGNNADVLNGGNGADTLNGNGGADTLNGNAGADTLNGNAGNDTLNGNGGADTLNGGNDADVLNGGIGNDVLTGGDGNDVFIFEDGFGNDTIVDFAASNAEGIDLSAVSAIINFNDLRTNHLTQVGNDAVIDDSAGNTITIENFNVVDLGNGDFLF